MTTLTAEPDHHHGAHPGQDYQALVDDAPGPLERLFVIASFYFLVYGFPDTAFRTVQEREAQALTADSDLTNTLASTAIYLGALAILLVRSWWIRESIRRDGLVVLLVGLALASTLWSVDPGVTLRRSLALALGTVFAYYVAARFPLSGLLRLLLVALAVGTVLSIIWATALPRYGLDLEGRWLGVASHKNALARHQVLTILVALFVLPSLRWRLPALVIAGLAAFAMAMTQGTTAVIALLSLAVLLPVWAAFRARRTMFGAVLVSLSAMTVAVGWFVSRSFADIVQLTGKDVTLTGRTGLWQAVQDRIADRPVLGYGYEAFWTGWGGVSGEVWLDTGWLAPHSHNGLLEVLLNLGLVGGVVFVALLGRGLFRSVNYARNRTGIGALFPITIVSFSILYSTTEKGVVIQHSIYWVLLVVVLLTVGGPDGRVRRRTRPSAPAPMTAATAHEVGPG